MIRGLLQTIQSHADSRADQCALFRHDTCLTYAELILHIEHHADRLQAAGVADGHVVGIQCEDDIRHLLWCLASARLGAASVSLPGYEPASSRDDLALRCGASHRIQNDTITPQSASVTENAYEQFTADDPPLFFTTSGTSGRPKIVVLHSSDIVAQAHRHIHGSNDRFACLAAVEHNFSKRHRLYCLARGATNVFLSGRPDSLAAECKAAKVSTLHVSAFQARELLTTPDGAQLQGIRLKLGGSHANQGLRKRLRAGISPRLYAGYGTTETGAIAFTDPDDDKAGESVGKPLPGMDIEILDAHGKALDRGELGEIVVRAEGLFRGYLGEPELTRQRLRGGRFYTGDIGSLDAGGRLRVTGRKDDMFVFNSMNIYPQELESIIRQHPAVADAMVIPRHSATHGDIPVALLVFEKNVKQRLAEVERYVHNHAGVRRPRQYLIVEQLPKNPSGKFLRSEAARVPQDSARVRRQMLALLNEKTRGKIRHSDAEAFVVADTDIPLRPLAMDSLDRMEFLVALETEFDVMIPPEDFAGFRYLGNVASRIMRHSTGETAEQDIPVASTWGSRSGDEPGPAVPPCVRLLRRLEATCPTAVQLNHALGLLERRATPLDIDVLNQWYRAGRLLPDTGSAEKSRRVIGHWLNRLGRWLANSGKCRPEGFQYRRIAPHITLFSGATDATPRSLILCFPPYGHRTMQMPSAVLLQHVDASRHDVLIIAEPHTQGFRPGQLPFGKNFRNMLTSLSAQSWFHSYQEIRVLGFCAGSDQAIVASQILSAEVAVSVGGRFFKRRYWLRNLDKVVTGWLASRFAHCSRTYLCHAADNRRDRQYAQLMSRLLRHQAISVRFADAQVGHLLINRLLDSGQFGAFLDHTLFREPEDHSAAGDGRFELQFPGPVLSGSV